VSAKTFAGRVIAIQFGLRESLKSEVYMSYHLYDEPDGDQHTAYYFWLIEHEEGPILVDTGFSPAGGQRRNRKLNIHPVQALRAVGVAPEDVRLVIMTHLHYDHAGNIGEFPNARIVLARRELEFWRSDIAKNTLFSFFFDPESALALEAAEKSDRLGLFEGQHHAAEGVRVIEVGGHSPGQAIVEVDTADGTLLLTSDAVHFNEELDDHKPFCSMSDLPTSFAVFDEIQAGVAEGKYCDVVTGHDPLVATAYRPVDEITAPFAVVLSPRANP
jgi:glyoxylase-like metal-dependent hydrolase (beta-lactamase superfamily II)